MQPPSATWNAGEDEIRGTAQRAAALLADRRSDQAKLILAVSAERKFPGLSANLAHRRKQQIGDGAQQRHGPSLREARAAVTAPFESINYPSRPFFPRLQVLPLLRREFVDAHAHGLQFQPGHLLVNVYWHRIDIGLQ